MSSVHSIIFIILRSSNFSFMKIDQVKTLLRKMEDEIPVIRPGINTFYKLASAGAASEEADWIIQIDMDVLAVDHIKAIESLAASFWFKSIPEFKQDRQFLVIQDR